MATANDGKAPGFEVGALISNPGALSISQLRFRPAAPKPQCLRTHLHVLHDFMPFQFRLLESQISIGVLGRSTMSTCPILGLDCSIANESPPFSTPRPPR